MLTPLTLVHHYVIHDTLDTHVSIFSVPSRTKTLKKKKDIFDTSLTSLGFLSMPNFHTHTVELVNMGSVRNYCSLKQNVSTVIITILKYITM